MESNAHDPRDPDLSEYADHIASADRAFENGQFLDAARAYERASRAACSNAARALGLKNSGIALRRLGQPDAALARARQARDALSTDPSDAVGPEIDLLVGNCLADQGQWGDADRELLSAAQGFSKSGRSTEYVQATIGRGRVLAEQGDTVASLALFSQLETIRLPTPLRSQVLNNLAILERRLGHAARAAALLEEDFQLSTSADDKYGAAVAAFNAAGAYDDLGDTQQATDFAVRARSLFLAVGAMSDASRASALLKEFVPQHDHDDD